MRRSSPRSSDAVKRATHRVPISRQATCPSARAAAVGGRLLCIRQWVTTGLMVSTRRRGLGGIWRAARSLIGNGECAPAIACSAAHGPRVARASIAESRQLRPVGGTTLICGTCAENRPNFGARYSNDNGVTTLHPPHGVCLEIVHRPRKAFASDWGIRASEGWPVRSGTRPQRVGGGSPQAQANIWSPHRRGQAQGGERGNE